MRENLLFFLVANVVLTGKKKIFFFFFFFFFRRDTFIAAFLTQTVCLNDTTVKFEIWDTAGQERYVVLRNQSVFCDSVNRCTRKQTHRYHSLAPMYYRGARPPSLYMTLRIPTRLSAARAGSKSCSAKAIRTLSLRSPATRSIWPTNVPSPPRRRRRTPRRTAISLWRRLRKRPPTSTNSLSPLRESCPRPQRHDPTRSAFTLTPPRRHKPAPKRARAADDPTVMKFAISFVSFHLVSIQIHARC
jgi:hypothetical protein